MQIERTLVLIKPDGVERGLVGQILTRFEQAGLKVVGLKLLRCQPEQARRHYTEDVAVRRGSKVREMMVEMLVSGPVVSIVLEGIEAVSLVRKLVGPTEPSAAQPGTIRGDFAHVSFGYANQRNLPVKNVIHASSSLSEAKEEIAVWFAENELVTYESVHDRHVFG